MSYTHEPLITLAEAKKICGYTQDHLAYLCRRSFVWAERHGRVWLTCEAAVKDYQVALKISGSPKTVPEQEPLLAKAEIKPEPVIKVPESVFNFTAAPLTNHRDRWFELLELEKAGTESRQGNWAKMLWDMPVVELFSRVFEIALAELTRTQFTENLLEPHPALHLNFAFATAPQSLPVADLPDYLKMSPWFMNRMLLVPVTAVFLGVILVGSHVFY